MQIKRERERKLLFFNYTHNIKLEVVPKKIIN